MAQLLPQYKKAVIDEIVNSINSGTSNYYAVAANPIAFAGNTPADVVGEKTSSAITNWTMLFGKKLTNTNILPVVSNATWVQNTVYSMYDDTADLSNSSFYCIVTAGAGADYLFYKCIYNNNGALSTNTPPTSTQYATITLPDGYMWRYVASVPSATYASFSANSYVPVLPNNSIVANAGFNSGVDVVLVTNGGVAYTQYCTGNVGTVSNSTYVQIVSNNMSITSNVYGGTAVYIANQPGNTNPQLANVLSSNTANPNNSWLTLSSQVNTAQITANAIFIVAPRVLFDTDGVTEPLAYCTINSISQTVNSVVVINTGTYVSRCNASIYTTNSSFGSNSTIRPIVPPPGGHGSNPVHELFCQGIGFSFKFANTDGANVLSNVIYNKIGIMKNPFVMSTNTSTNSYGAGFKTATPYTSNTFSQVLVATVSPATTFTVGNYIWGGTSMANGIVAFSNSTTLYIAGDKAYISGENVTANNGQSANITITSVGSIYSRELDYLYVQNTDNITRSPTQTEAFKFIVKI